MMPRNPRDMLRAAVARGLRERYILADRVPKPPPKSPFERDANELFAIEQRSAIGIKTFDIIPWRLGDDYKSSLKTDVTELFGSFYSPNLQGLIGNLGGISLFRTVELSVNANWVKVEFLPLPMNRYGQDQANSYPNFEAATISNPATTVNGSLSQVCLIQFESQANRPIVVKHGDMFELPVNTIFLSMPMFCSPIRVTVGFNSKIKSNDVEPLRNRSLSLGPGTGLWDDRNANAVPFCLTAFDIASPNDYIDVQVGIPQNYTLLTCLPINSSPLTTDTQNAWGVGWLTNISLCVVSFGKLASEVVTGSIRINDLRNRLVYLPFSTVNNGGAFNNHTTSVQWSPAEPVRYNITSSGNQLTVRLKVDSNIVGSANICRFFISINGYSWGSLNSVGVLTPAPYDHAVKIGGCGYPMDQSPGIRPFF